MGCIAKLRKFTSKTMPPRNENYIRQEYSLKYHRLLACSIHSRLLLCGSIMVLKVYSVKDMLYFIFAVAASGIADRPAAGNVIIGKHFLIDS